VDWAEQYVEIWNSRDGQRVADFVTDDSTWEDLGLNITHVGREAIVAFVAEIGQLSSDYVFKKVAVQESGDSYCLEWEMTGTNTGAGAGLTATNKPYRIRGVSVGIRQNGKIRQNRDYWNLADYLAQVGLLPAP
jgi:steroid delta-isomerase-like uncharacterized protein